MSGDLCIISAGALTPVGLSSEQTCAAVRAGVSAFAQSDFMLQSASYEPILAASVPLRPKPADSKPRGRCAALAKHALRECLRSASLNAAAIPLLMGIAEDARLEAFRTWFGEDFHSGVREQILSRFHPHSELLPYGNAASFAALVRARELLQSEVAQACIVGGVDSLLNPADLDRIERTWRLHKEGEAYGLIPGEAAAFIAVCLPERAQDRDVLGVIAGIGLDAEDAATTVLSEGHPTGKGLERAFSKAVQDARLQEADINLRVSDLNGERYGAIDAMLAVSRFCRSERHGLPIWHPAECVGETGAAVGALLLQIACHAVTRRRVPFAVAMCETSSESGMRAACLVRPGRLS